MSDRKTITGRIPGVLAALAKLTLVLGAGYLLSANVSIDQQYLFAAVLLGFVSCEPGLWRRQSR